MNMTIGRRIAAGFTGCVVVLAVMGGFAYIEFRQLVEEVHTVAEDSFPAAVDATRCVSALRGSALATMRHIFTENPEFMAKEEAGNVELGKEIDGLYTEIEARCDTPEEKQLVADCRTAAGPFRAARTKVLGLSRDGKKTDAARVVEQEMRPAQDTYRAALDKLATYFQTKGHDRGISAVAAAQFGQRAALITLIGGLGVAIFLGWWIGRGINKVLNALADSLGQSASEVASASQQIANAGQSLASGASEQAASLEETSSSLEELSAMTNKNAEAAQQATNLADDARGAAGKGNDAMSKMSGAIHDIEKSAQDTAKIIKVIDEIAFQTNLLALNAAVEAARAGEAGKGFAVVAEEVRNLAMRSAEAAKNTAAMIETSVSSARNGVTIAGTVGERLAEIVQKSDKVGSLIAEIAASSGEQTKGIAQINTAVTQMDKVTQSGAANAEESAAASEELSAQAQQMKSMVNELLQLVRGARATQVSTPTSTPSLRKPQASATKSASKPSKQASKPTDFDDFNLAA